MSTAEIEPVTDPAPARTGKLQITLQIPTGRQVGEGQTVSAYLVEGIDAVQVPIFRPDGTLAGAVVLSHATPEQVDAHDTARRQRAADAAASRAGAARTMGATVVR